jgi:hypothetical protein
MSEEEGSFLGGLGQAADGLINTAEDLGSAAYNVGAVEYHAAAATVDAFLDDREGTDAHQDAREQARTDGDQAFGDAARDFGIE